MLDTDLVVAVGALDLYGAVRDANGVEAFVRIGPRSRPGRFDHICRLRGERVGAAEALFGLGNHERAARRKIASVCGVCQPPDSTYDGCQQKTSKKEDIPRFDARFHTRSLSRPAAKRAKYARSLTDFEPSRMGARDMM